MKVVGLMSGTSYDAVDVAAAELRIVGDALRLVPLGEMSYPLTPRLRERVRDVLPPGPTTARAMCELDALLGRTFADAAARAVAQLCDGRADLVVSHGQTVYHWVEEGLAQGTLQLGQPAWIAERTGVPVVSDLRSRDIARGGQGAPLVAVFDALLLVPEGEQPTARAALNLGGIANATVVPAGPGSEGAVLAYDLGPGNALLDAAVHHYFGEPCDRDGRHAARGAVREDLLAALRDEPYFAARPPKSTGKELFHWGYVEQRLRRIDPAGRIDPDDVVATVGELTARLVVESCLEHQVAEVVVSGGGLRNPWLMRRIRHLGDDRLAVRPVDAYGIPADAKEAYAFAVLGFLTVHGLPGTLPTCTGAQGPSLLGNITPGRGPLRLPSPVADPPRRLVVERRAC